MKSLTPHVVIVGGGFGGLWAAQALADAPVKITLVDKKNHHLFQPLLYQVATAGLSSAEIAAPLRHILRDQENVTVQLAEVSSVNADQKKISLVDGEEISYDYLVLAAGSIHTYFGKPEWEEFATGLKTLNDALRMRRRILLAFEHAEAAKTPKEQAAWLSFAVVGGGPTGVELAGTLAEIAHHTMKNEFRNIDPTTAKVRLIESSPRVLATFPEELSAKALTQLHKLGVEVSTGSRVADINAEGFQLGDQFIPAKTVLWAAGVAASPLGAGLNTPRDRAGRVQVNPDLSVPEYPEVFVVGDLASLMQADGKPVPGLATAAKQMGTYAAQVIIAKIAVTSAPEPFAYYDFGSLATIGRRAAVVDLKGFKFSGLPAWWFWLLTHIFFLIGFRNRVTVLINWAWAYWTYQRHARVILGGTPDAAWKPAEEKCVIHDTSL